MYTKCEKKKVCVRERQREGEGGGGGGEHGIYKKNICR